MTSRNLEEVWPEWKIEKQIGRGSFGVVYKAVRVENELTSSAAIKVISIPQDQSEMDSLRAEGLDLCASRTYLKEIVDDFINEIRLMEPFKGIQNIVSIEDYKVIEKKDEIGWDIFIRMELLTPFNTYISDKRLTEQEVIKLGCDICTALDICAKRNIIHRDIKPENIFVNSFGDFKLGDFGTARKMENLFCGMSQKGTYNYMAPEAISGTEYDGRVDIYSLGLVLYRLMNENRLPFVSERQLLSPAERQGAFERRIRGEALPAPCNASKSMADVILKACAFQPEERYANAFEMKNALQQIGDDRVSVTEVDKKRSKAPLYLAIALLMVVLVGAGIGIGVGMSGAGKLNVQEEGAQIETQASNTRDEKEQIISQTPNPDEPAFEFDNISVSHSEFYSEDTGAGYNALGEPIRWCVLVEFDFPQEIRDEYTTIISCSWDHVVNGRIGEIWQETADFEMAKEGMTYAEFGSISAEYSDTGNDRFLFFLFLPDDPSIEGAQSVTIYVGSSELTINFNLVYDGDYDKGMGWHITDVQY